VDHAVGERNRLRPVRDMDAADRQFRKHLVDAALDVDIEIGGAFVDQKQPRLPLQRTRQQHTLALAGGQCRTEAADHRAIPHWHAADVVVDAGVLGRLRNARRGLETPRRSRCSA
jgi:hypothetical protein